MSNFAPSNGGLPLSVTNPGKQFWVNSSSVFPKNGAPGRADSGVSITGKGTYLRPFATINQALSRCTANRGDVVFVMPGYTETVSSAGGGFALSVAGVAIVGLGSGDLKPTITLGTATSSDINVSADDTSIFNFRFVSGIANLTNVLDITGSDVTIDSCEFRAGAAATACLTSITSSNTAFGLTVKNNIFNQESDIVGVAVTDVAVQAISFDGDNTTIIDNFINGDFTVTGILNVTTVAEGIIVARNNISNVAAGDIAGGISIKALTSGLCYDNTIYVGDSTAIVGMMDNASLLCFENKAVNETAESAITIPTLAST